MQSCHSIVILLKPRWFRLTISMICTIWSCHSCCQIMLNCHALAECWADTRQYRPNIEPAFDSTHSRDDAQGWLYVIRFHYYDYTQFTLTTTIGIHDKQVLHNLNTLSKSTNFKPLQKTPAKCNQIKKPKYMLSGFFMTFWMTQIHDVKDYQFIAWKSKDKTVAQNQ